MINDGILVLGLSGTGKTSYFCGVCLDIQKGGMNDTPYKVHMTPGKRIRRIGPLEVTPAVKFISDLLQKQEGSQWSPTHPSDPPRVLNLFRAYPGPFSKGFDIWSADMPGETWSIISGQADIPENIDPERLRNVQLVQHEILPRTSAFIFLLDGSAEQTPAFWQTNWFEEVYAQTPHLHKQGIPVPVVFALTKADVYLNIPEPGLEISLPLMQSAYNSWLARPSNKGSLQFKHVAGKIIYNVPLKYILDEDKYSDEDELEAVSRDVLQVISPEVYKYIFRLSKDERFDVKVFSCSAWGHELEKDKSLYDIVPSVSAVKPARVLTPVKSLLGSIMARKKFAFKRTVEKVTVAAIILLLLAGPGFFHLSAFLGDYFAKNENIKHSLSAYRFMNINPYGQFVANQFEGFSDYIKDSFLTNVKSYQKMGHDDVALSLLGAIDFNDSGFNAVKYGIISDLTEKYLKRDDDERVLRLCALACTIDKLPDSDLASLYSRVMYEYVDKGDLGLILLLKKKSDMKRFQYSESAMAKTLYHLFNTVEKLDELQSEVTRDLSDVSPAAVEVTLKKLDDLLGTAALSGSRKLYATTRKHQLLLAAFLIKDKINESKAAAAGSLTENSYHDKVEQVTDVIISLVRRYPEFLPALFTAREEIVSSFAVAFYENVESDPVRSAMLADAVKYMRSAYYIGSLQPAYLACMLKLQPVKRLLENRKVEETTEMLDAAIFEFSLIEVPVMQEDLAACEAREKTLASFGDVSKLLQNICTDNHDSKSLLALELLDRFAVLGSGIGGGGVGNENKKLAVLLECLKKALMGDTGGSEEYEKKIKELYDACAGGAHDIGKAVINNLTLLRGELLKNNYFPQALSVLKLQATCDKSYQDLAEFNQMIATIHLAWAAQAATQVACVANINQALQPWLGSDGISSKEFNWLSNLSLKFTATTGSEAAFDWALLYQLRLFEIPCAEVSATERAEKLLNVVLSSGNDIKLLAARAKLVHKYLEDNKVAYTEPQLHALWTLVLTDATAVETEQWTLLEMFGDKAVGVVSEEARCAMLAPFAIEFDKAYEEAQTNGITRTFKNFCRCAAILKLDTNRAVKQLIDSSTKHIENAKNMVLIRSIDGTDKPLFYFDCTETTVKEYALFLNGYGNKVKPQATPLNFPSTKGSHEPDNWAKQLGASGDEMYLPVRSVDWYDAFVCAAWYGCRLPMESEWRLVAYHGVDREYPWGDDGECEKTVDSDGLLNVLSLKQSEDVIPGMEIYGMGGNVKEWCTVAEALTSGNRPVMGSSWKDTKRYAARSRESEEKSPIVKDDVIGFRKLQDLYPAGLKEWVKHYAQKK